MQLAHPSSPSSPALQKADVACISVLRTIDAAVSCGRNVQACWLVESMFSQHYISCWTPSRWSACGRVSASSLCRSAGSDYFLANNALNPLKVSDPGVIAPKSVACPRGTNGRDMTTLGRRATSIRACGKQPP
jgi:hypothetical protein